jgi:hypothetical protein
MTLPLVRVLWARLGLITVRLREEPDGFRIYVNPRHAGSFHERCTRTPECEVHRRIAAALLAHLGDALVALAEAEHHVYGCPEPFDQCGRALCRSARTWRAARAGAHDGRGDGAGSASRPADQVRHTPAARTARATMTRSLVF